MMPASVVSQFTFHKSSGPPLTASSRGCPLLFPLQRAMGRVQESGGNALEDQYHELPGCNTSRMLKKSASFVGAPIAALSWCNGSDAKRLNPEGVSPFAKIHAKGERFTRSADETRNPLVDFSSGVNTEGLRPMSRWFTPSAVCTSSPPRSLRPRWTTFLNILRAFLVRSVTSSSPMSPGCHNSFSTTC